MKRVRSTLIKAALVCLVVAVTWFVGNWKRLLPEQDSVAAASFVAERYMQPRSAEGFLAIASGKQPVYPFGEMHTFDIRDGGQTVAKVQLNTFLGLGWLEQSFARADP